MRLKALCFDSLHLHTAPLNTCCRRSLVKIPNPRQIILLKVFGLIVDGTWIEELLGLELALVLPERIVLARMETMLVLFCGEDAGLGGLIVEQVVVASVFKLLRVD